MDRVVDLSRHGKKAVEPRHQAHKHNAERALALAGIRPEFLWQRSAVRVEGHARQGADLIGAYQRAPQRGHDLLHAGYIDLDLDIAELERLVGVAMRLLRVDDE